MKKRFFALPCLLLLGLTAVADEPPGFLNPAPSAPPRPALQPMVPRPVQPVAPPAVAPHPATSEVLQNGTIQMDFPGTPVTDVLSFYGTLTGQQVVCDNTVQGLVTLKTSQAVSREQAEAMIETAMFINGFSLVDSEDGSILKVVGLGKAPHREGVPLFTDAAELPKRERVVSLLVNLHNLRAQTTGGLLSAYVPPNPSISFVPMSEHVVVITGQTSLVRRLSKVVEAVDTKENTLAISKSLPPPASKKAASSKAGADEDDD